MVVANNTMKDPVASTNTGIFVYSCESVDVNGNVIIGLVQNYNSCIKLENAVYSNVIGNIANGSTAGIYIKGSGSGNDITVKGNRVINFTSNGILLENSSNGTCITENVLTTSVAVTGINLSAAIFNIVCNNNIFYIPVGSSAIVINASAVSNNYDVSFNTTFTRSVVDAGPAGATKRLINNW